MIIKKEVLSIKNNLTDFNTNEMIGIVKRDKNKKRSFLLLNKLQSKHYPSDPIETNKLFSLLSKTVYSKYSNKKNVLVIGFAETAVAIGTYVAVAFKNSYYVQTTREDISDKPFLTFSEVHSHAVTHKIYTDNLQEIIEKADLIVIVDDEFTTGNTAINLINTLKKEYKIKNDCDICMASILSCMNQQCLQRIRENNIHLISLIDAQINEENINFPVDFLLDNTYNQNHKKDITFYRVSGKTTPIYSISSMEYINKCDEFISSVIDIVNPINTQNSILVIGTEEFSFCALRLGIILKKTNNNVKVQCTTQSPILPSCQEGYTINNRSRLTSLYDKNRVTYIYQMEHYDTAIILTDAENPSEQAKKQLIDSVNADRIFFIQWGK